MRIVFALLIFALACAAQAGVVNGGFESGLDGWAASDGLADWWVVDGALAARTQSKMTNMAWITNIALPAGVYNYTYDVLCNYSQSIVTQAGIRIGDSTATTMLDVAGWTTQTARLATDGGLVSLGVWTATDSLVYFDNVSVEAVPEASALLILATGCVALFRKLRR